MTTRGKFLFALIGGALLAAAVLLLGLHPYRAQTIVASAGGCNMRVDIVEPASGGPQGYVVLLHGLSANKRIMWYVAEGFANQNLRVFVPDLPGHGRTHGPFTPQRAESCAESFVEQLIDRRAIVPQRTILAGHSMGGAIAVRIASRIPVAGTVAISPAPMRPGHGVWREMLLFYNSGPLPPHSLVISGAWEPASMRESAEALVRSGSDTIGKYQLIRHASHVSLIFDPATVLASQQWASLLLGINGQAQVPSLASLFGALLGVAGLGILAVPFLHEVVAQPASVPASEPPSPPRPAFSLLQVAVVSALAVTILKLGVPLRFLGIFQGDYLASFFLMSGAALIAWNWNLVKPALHLSWRPVAAAAFAALMLILLFGGWFDLTFSEAWLTLPRWVRFPGMLLALLAWHFAEEVMLGSPAALSRRQRLSLALSFRALAWLAMTAALFYLHSGEILIVLLTVYFAVFFVLQRLAVDVVHRETRSAAAAAVFGAILFAGLALAIFPVA